MPNDPITPDSPSIPPPRRIPNIGHALLLLSFVAILLFAAQVALVLLHKQVVDTQGGKVVILHPILQLAAEAIVYLITLVFAWLIFPRLWHRPFLDGIQWHWSIARVQAVRLITLGFALSVIVALLTVSATPPKDLPMDDFFLKPSTAWLMTLFGIFIAPPVEEIGFRGFLFPAFAIAYDWIALPRTPEARDRWQSTTTLTPASLVFSAVLTSVLFAWMHSDQYAHFWASLLGIFFVSLALCWARTRTQSVAASALVHASYNAALFIGPIIATAGYRHLDRLAK